MIQFVGRIKKIKKHLAEYILNSLRVVSHSTCSEFSSQHHFKRKTHKKKNSSLSWKNFCGKMNIS